MKRFWMICLIAGLAFAPISAFAQESAESILAHFKNEPTVEETMEAAIQYAGLDNDRFDSMNSRAIAANAMPKSLSYELTYRDQDRNRPQKTATFKSNNEDEWTELKRTEYKEDTDYINHKFRAQWDLSKLVYNSDQLRVAVAMGSAADKRDKLLLLVSKTYYDRRKKQISMLVSPSNDVTTQIEDMLKLEELTARLNALTGGWFSKNIQR